MFLDYQAILDDAASITAAGNPTSTYYIDMLSTGFGHNDECYAQFLIDTSFTITAGASITCAIWVANETTFSSASLVASKIVKWDSTTASAKYVLATLHIGPDVYKQNWSSTTDSPYRYLYAIYTLTTAVSAGKIDCRLVKDIDMTMDKVL